MKNKILKFNNTIALFLTNKFGSMWMFYIFVIYGLLPCFALFHPHQEAFLYFSNWIQLWSLPLIMVGTNLLNKDAEERAVHDHELLKASYDEQSEMDKKVMEALDKLTNIMEDMNKQDEILNKQDKELENQTSILQEQTTILKEEKEVLQKAVPPQS